MRDKTKSHCACQGAPSHASYFLDDVIEAGAGALCGAIPLVGGFLGPVCGRLARSLTGGGGSDDVPSNSRRPAPRRRRRRRVVRRRRR